MSGFDKRPDVYKLYCDAFAEIYPGVQLAVSPAALNLMAARIREAQPAMCSACGERKDAELFRDLYHREQQSKLAAQDACTDLVRGEANVTNGRALLVKRGTIASFRRYLNEKYAYSEPHKYERYHQRSREYGDYLYHQDRNKFNVELQEALAGNEEYHDWERP